MNGDKKRTILVINDVASKRFMTKEILEHEGFSVKTADSWANARDRIEEGGVALVIMDLKTLKDDALDLDEMISSLKVTSN